MLSHTKYNWMSDILLSNDCFLLDCFPQDSHHAMVKLVRQTVLMQLSGEKKVAALLVMNIRCPRVQHLSENYDNQ